MWTTDSLWFEIAAVSIVYALGNILLGHFEERTPTIKHSDIYDVIVIKLIALHCKFPIYAL